MTMRALILSLLSLLTLPLYSIERPTLIKPTDVSGIIHELDAELKLRDVNIGRRKHRLDSLSARVNSGRLSIVDFRKIGAAATGFDNDLAVTNYIRAAAYADSIGDHRSAAEFSLDAASLMPLGGLTTEAIDRFTAVDTTGFDLAMMRHYFNCGRRMYDYIGNLFTDYPALHAHYDSLSLRMMERLITLNDREPKTQEATRLVNLGEYLYLTGNHRRARQELIAALDASAMTDNNFAIAAYLLAAIADDLDNENEQVYYLGLSALADTRAATREVTSLQRLGKYMLDCDDIDRAHLYFSEAMQNAIEAHAATRMIQTAAQLPIIERIHNRELAQSQKRIHILIFIMGVLIVMLAIALAYAHRRNTYRRRLQRHLEESNLAKETYISRFLDLSAIYMDKLNQFCKVVANKISTGQTDELYRLTRSGKFVENNSTDFYSIFDDAFLHMYPDFVAKVNSLLRDDAQIVLKDGEKLNTDLRILAFMRLGIDDTAKVGRILNYSVNTIYAYRNKIRNRAKDRDNFEAAITSL